MDPQGNANEAGGFLNTDIVGGILAWGGPVVIIAGITVFLWWLARQAFPDTHNGRIARQTVQVLLVVVSVVALILSLPFSTETAGQLLNLLGLAVTAVIALSSTTFVANAMAGIMLRIVRSFRVGDFIHVAGDFGRVTERQFLHTEIQTEDRDLITLPNLFLITQPVRVVRRSGTIISAEVSLGFDVHRSRISELLSEAAVKAELEEPFVRIMEIGDYSVVYRVSGFLADTSQMVTKRSRLRAMMMDQLHEAGIEIVSPSFMNQRQVPELQIPRRAADDAGEEGKAESMMFDKAEVAKSIDDLRIQRDKLVLEITEIAKDESMDKARKDHESALRQKHIEQLEQAMAAMEVETEK